MIVQRSNSATQSPSCRRLARASFTVEEARAKRQLHSTICELQATIGYQGSLLSKENIIDASDNKPFLRQILAFSTFYRKARTSPHDPFHHIKYSFVSRIYTTHSTGCKISFRIFPYGVNIFRGTHTSICCELHFSDFTLPRTWPFDRKVEVAILDQKDKDNKWSISLPFFNKDEHKNHTSDYTLPGLIREDFIPHTKLLANFREAFLNNDSVIIQIKFISPPSKSLVLKWPQLPLTYP